jgi:L-iditol 2-dehydrogenase
MAHNVRAAVMLGPGHPIELREIPSPTLATGEALLRVKYSEVCGTDVHLHEGRLTGVPYPLIPGHVTVGVLEEIRGSLHDVEGRVLSEGNEVTFLDVHATCHACWYCLVAKASTRCPSRKVYGITYGLSDGLTGGWADKLHIKAGTQVIPLRGADARLFMAGGCGLPTALHAVERSGVAFGDTVLVLGAGPVGLAAIALSRLRGAGTVLCIGAPANRLDVARRMGADDCIDITIADVEERGRWVSDRTEGRGADVTVEATGAPQAVAQAMRWTRDAGVVAVVGQYTDCGNADFNPHRDLNRKHLDVRAVWGSDYSHFHKSVRLLQNPAARALLNEMECVDYPLELLNEALADVAAGRSVKALVTPGS